MKVFKDENFKDYSKRVAKDNSGPGCTSLKFGTASAAPSDIQAFAKRAQDAEKRIAELTQVFQKYITGVHADSADLQQLKLENAQLTAENGKLRKKLSDHLGVSGGSASAAPAAAPAGASSLKQTAGDSDLGRKLDALCATYMHEDDLDHSIYIKLGFPGRHYLKQAVAMLRSGRDAASLLKEHAGDEAVVRALQWVMDQINGKGAKASMNRAFVFIKPHANTKAAQALVKSTFDKKGIKITAEGELTGEQIDAGQLIDQHYYAIASKATILKPHQLPVPADKFKAHFGIEWEAALEQGNVYNAMDACKYFGMDGAQLEGEWRKIKKKVVKFGGGFYCGLVDTVKGKDPIYVFNAFFMSMRAAFVKPGTSIHYYVVEFDSSSLQWADFRGKVLGPTNPADAPKDSLRGLIMSDWKRLGLTAEPDTGNNGVHASASPFEGLAERMNWLGVDMAQDEFGKSLLDAGVSQAAIKDWSIDPQIEGVGSLFDSMEDLDCDDCIAKGVEIFKATNKGKKKNSKKKKSKKKSSGKKNKEKKGKAGKKGASKEEEQAIKVKACIKEGGKKGQDICGLSDMGGVRFFHITLDAPEGDMDLMDSALEGFNKEVDEGAEDRKGGAGNLGKFLFSYNDTKVAMLCHLPKEFADKVDISEWFSTVAGPIGGQVVSQEKDGEATIIVRGEAKSDPGNGKYSIKMRDMAINDGYNYLLQKKLVLEGDSDDDEMVFGDDDFPDY